jgi:rhodanese-related sulfurtransferase
VQAKKLLKNIVILFILGLLVISFPDTNIIEGIRSSKYQNQGQNNNLKILSNTEPELSFYPDSHDFGDKYIGETDNTTFEIWNSGCCTLFYWLVENCSWIDVNPKNGTSTGEHDKIDINIDTTNMNYGKNIYNITILSSGEENGIFTVLINIISSGYTNITVEDSWDLLIDTGNGIQTPIDVRTDHEWKTAHINTPPPENPKHHHFNDFNNNTRLEKFKSTYSGNEIIIYSETGHQSKIVAQILVENKFNGKIYNMIGGINEWKTKGLPIKADTPPTIKVVNPVEGYIHFSGRPLFPTILDVLGDTIAIGGFRMNPMMVDAIDDYNTRADLTVKFFIDGEELGEGVIDNCSHHTIQWTGFAIGTFNVTVTVWDAYQGNNTASISVRNFCILP